MNDDNIDVLLEELDIRAEDVRCLLMRASDEQVAHLWRQLDLSIIYHDWALDGQVVTPDELEMAFDARDIFDSSSLPLIQTIRSHRDAIALARQISRREKIVFDIEMFREFHALCSSNPEEGLKGEYRKEIPLHRTYLHEIQEPGTIEESMKELVQWLANPVEEEGEAIHHPVLFVSKFHHKFMRIFPYLETSGKMGRLMANMVLMHHGYLPAVIHATERQRYYETLKDPRRGLTNLIVDSLESSLEAAERFLTF